MHIHILGICGTFMGGIAAIASQAGHTVTGCDRHVYPPMSIQLEKLGIVLHQGFDEDQIQQFCPDAFLVGNVMTRGMPIIERMLSDKVPMISGPEWLYQNVLNSQQTIIAIAGTHGKTTTASLAAWILEESGFDPGFLIGGLPGNFNTSARQGKGKVFVIEADEYDTAFFDKRSKFIHYHPDILVLNNLEFDHADIFHSLNDIQRQFNHLLKLVPENGQILANSDDKNIRCLIEMGLWSSLEYFGRQAADWQYSSIDNSKFTIGHQSSSMDALSSIPGTHNQMNALAAIAACHKAGVEIESAISALARFKPPRRRLEIRFTDQEITVYDDFAHHPTAISETIKAVKTSEDRYLTVIFEPRSNSMRSGAHNHGLNFAFDLADEILFYQPPDNKCDFGFLQEIYSRKLIIHADTEKIIEHLQRQTVKPRDVIFMSNGGFENIVSRYIKTLVPDDSHKH